jgi:hypothetical protein
MHKKILTILFFVLFVAPQTEWFGDIVPALADTVEDTTLVGYWKFDEGEGDTAYDSSGYGNDGTLMNDPTWTNGISGKALQFDGIDDCVAIPDLYTSSPSELTAMAWINSPLPPSVSGLRVIHHFRKGEFSLAISPSGGSAEFAVKLTDGVWYVVQATPTADVWHHLAGVWTKGDSLKLYIDGSLVNQTSVPDLYLWDWNGPASIGSYGRYTHFFSGTIDEVKVYTRALSAEEIWQEFVKAPVGYWKFDEGTGDTAYDASSYGNHGILMNGPTWVDGLPLLGKALDFDGTDDYVIVSDAPGLDVNGPGITFMAWVYSPAFNEYGWIMGKGTSGGNIVWCTLARTNNYVRYWIRSGGVPTEREVPDVLSTNIWQHVAVVYDGSYMRYYLNAVEKDYFPKTGNMDVNDQPIYIGLDGWFQTNHYRGRIDEVKIYGRALSPEEIEAEFEAGFTRGDANGDGIIDIGDVIYLINYLFTGTSAPGPLAAGDANCDGIVDIGDVIYLINYLFTGTSPPGC